MTAPTLQHELDHTDHKDQELACPEISTVDNEVGLDGPSEVCKLAKLSINQSIGRTHNARTSAIYFPLLITGQDLKRGSDQVRNV